MFTMDAKTTAKMHIVRKVNSLACDISNFAGTNTELVPDDAGLGTDGTCWTDEEIRGWLEEFFKRAKKVIKETP